jgi:hypothetical protein
MPLAGFNVKVVEQGGQYIVSGSDAAKLHDKLQKAPPEKSNLSIGEFKDGIFTLQKNFALTDLPPVG